jgi:hypothetical protein
MFNFSISSFKMSVDTYRVNHWQVLNFSQLILSQNTNIRYFSVIFKQNTNTSENLTLLYTLNTSGWLAVLKSTVY